LPSELTEAIRARTGAGGFSRYVIDAVQHGIQHDLRGGPRDAKVHRVPRAERVAVVRV
jgi:hypothetical protein